MAKAFRTVRLILQNSTEAVLTIQGFAVIRGSWVALPKEGNEVGMQETGEWTSQSTELGVGTAAFVRFGTSHGYIAISWQQPWAGPFGYEIRLPPHFRDEVVVDRSIPDNVVLVVTLHDRRPDDAPEPSSR